MQEEDEEDVCKRRRRRTRRSARRLHIREKINNSFMRDIFMSESIFHVSFKGKSCSSTKDICI